MGRVHYYDGMVNTPFRIIISAPHFDMYGDWDGTLEVLWQYNSIDHLTSFMMGDFDATYAFTYQAIEEDLPNEEVSNDDITWILWYIMQDKIDNGYDIP